MSEINQVPDIVTPCHGKPLIVVTNFSGGYMGSDVPSEIFCPEPTCMNTWSPAGVSDEWNRSTENTVEANTTEAGKWKW